jgi:glycyl-tRNA synthetase beta chain
LLETLVYTTEYPTPILGSFDRQYLSLPEEVLVTVMQHHQKYFSVEGAEGKLAPHFVAVMNIDADPDGLVRHGHERVLRARFNDARFFWETDQKRLLAGRVEDLKHVTFHAKLGSYYEKTQRNMDYVKRLGGSPAAVRAAELAKCDLTTELVKEFTELQGVVGGLYARAQGEPEDVAQAIYDQYEPVPRTPDGQVLALADRLDTLEGFFGLGLMPTGSRDPFALRRAALGVVRILVEGRHSLPIPPELREFILDRVRYYFRDVRGYRYDEVNAVLAAGCERLPDTADRLEAISRVRPTENFEPLATSFKRIKNILRQAAWDSAEPPDPALIEAGPERDLYEESERVRERVRGLGYADALAAIASLRPKVDLFFDKVLVMAPDERVRRNRLAFLSQLLREFSTIADFSEIVISGE